MGRCEVLVDGLCGRSVGKHQDDCTCSARHIAAPISRQDEMAQADFCRSADDAGLLVDLCSFCALGLAIILSLRNEPLYIADETREYFRVRLFPPACDMFGVQS